MPPESVTTPLTVAKSGTQGGTVISQTTMSPWRNLRASSRLRTTLATPCTVPGDAATPVMTSGSVLGLAGSRLSALSTMATNKGSELNDVGAPRCKGGRQTLVTAEDDPVSTCEPPHSVLRRARPAAAN